MAQVSRDAIVWIVTGGSLATAACWHWSCVQRDTRTPQTAVAEYLLVAGLSLFPLSLLKTFSLTSVLSSAQRPRMDFSYAAFNTESLRGIPIRWHPGSSFAVNDVAQVCRALQEADFELMIFLKNDFTRMPLFILEQKLKAYDRVNGLSDLDVFVRRSNHAIARKP